jgi:hypothetical protein
MSLLEIAMYGVSLCRSAAPNEELETKISSAKGAKSLRAMAVDNHDLRDAVLASISAPQEALMGRFLRCDLKGVPLQKGAIASDEEIKSLQSKISALDPQIDLQSLDKKSLAKYPALSKFLKDHVQMEHYLLSFKKCGKQCCKPFRLSLDVAAQLHQFPLPTPGDVRDGQMHYRGFKDLWGTAADASHRPSLTTTAVGKQPKGCNKNSAREIVTCDECHKPRVLYAAKAITGSQKALLDHLLDDGLIYICGSPLFESSHRVHEGKDGPNPILLSPHTCSSPIERPYFSATRGKGQPRFSPCCFQCGAALATALAEDGSHSPCTACLAAGVKPRLPSKQVTSQKLAAKKRKAAVVLAESPSSSHPRASAEQSAPPASVESHSAAAASPEALPEPPAVASSSDGVSVPPAAAIPSITIASSSSISNSVSSTVPRKKKKVAEDPAPEASASTRVGRTIRRPTFFYEQ